MIDLGQRSEPCEIALPYGLSVTVKPVTTAGMAAAQAAARRAVEAIERQARERMDAELALDGLLDLSAEGERDGFYQAQLIRELAVWHVASWTGVELDGRPAPPPRRGHGALRRGRAVLSGVHDPPGAAERSKKRLYGRLPPCKGISLIVEHEQVSCANVSGLCCGAVAAGLDEIRGRLPIIRTSFGALRFFRVRPTPV
jgi:hypothetical protein